MRRDATPPPTFRTVEVAVDVATGVGTLRLNRPAKSNALDADMWREIPAALDFLDAHDRVRAVVLCAAGKNFCAGIDVSTPESLSSQLGGIDAATCPGRRAEALYRHVRRLQDSFTALERCRAPVVCAIQCPSMLRRARAESWSSLGGVAGRGAGRCSGFITRGPNAEGAKGAARASALGWLIARVSSARARGGGVVRTRRAVRARESRPRRARARSSATRGPRGVPSGVRAGPSSVPPSRLGTRDAAGAGAGSSRWADPSETLATRWQGHPSIRVACTRESRRVVNPRFFYPEPRQLSMLA